MRIGLSLAAFLSLVAGCVPGFPPPQGGDGPGDDRQPDRTASVGQRPVPPNPDRPVPSDKPDRDGLFPETLRAIDGTNNNLANPEWGAAHTAFLRLAGNDYADGLGAPGGADRPSPRAVSNAVAAQAESRPNGLGVTDYLWQWGQFLDHDIDETPVADPAEPLDILIPAGDPFFDPAGRGDVTMGLDRSSYLVVAGVREQFNAITAYIDASNVYGSDVERQAALRANDGSGRLKTSAGDLLPLNEAGLPNAPSAEMRHLFLAGDVRANEQAGLTAMHTLFVREHNFWADQFRDMMPGLTGDEIYEYARAVVAAEMQAITYNEFLPVLLGPDALGPYTGYDPEVNAGISNVFATAAYRVGHTMLSGTILRIDAAGNEIAAGHLSLADAFFNPELIRADGIDPLLRGLAAQTCQDIDNAVVDEVRNFLFGPPGAGGFDLASLNLQRGRDHGLPGYNAVRRAFGLGSRGGFAEISAADTTVGAQFASVYDDIEQVDAWIGMLAEPHAPGAMVGETLQAVLGDQFRRLRAGDRFWYERYLPREMVTLVEAQTLATIIRRNTAIGEELPEDVFRGR